MTDVVKIGLKFCGGCNSGYDRIAAVERLKREYGERIEFVSGDDPACSGLLVMAGCKTACVQVDEILLNPVWIVTDEISLERLAGDLSRFVEEKG